MCRASLTPRAGQAESASQPAASIDLIGATALGIGGMMGGIVGASLYTLLAMAIHAALFVSLLFDTVRSGSPATWITFLAVLGGSFALTALGRRGR